MSSRQSAGTGMRLLAEETLKDGACRNVSLKMAFFTAEEVAQWAAVWLTAGRAVEVHLFTIIVVDVVCRCSRWNLGGSSDCQGRSGNSGHGRGVMSGGFIGSDLIVRLL